MVIGNLTLPSSPYPYMDNATSFFNLINYVNNDLTGGWFSIFLVFSLFIVSVGALKMQGFSFSKSFAGGMWITALTTILLWFAGLIQDWLLILVIVALAASPIFIKNSETGFE